MKSLQRLKPRIWGHLYGTAGRVCVATLLPLLRSSIIFHFPPTACAVGCILLPLRSYFTGCNSIFQKAPSVATQTLKCLGMKKLKDFIGTSELVPSPGA